MKEMEVKPWLIRMGQGEEEAFHQVYELTRDYAYRLIYFLAPSKVDVPDIMSEVYLELYRCRKQYRQEQLFTPWFNGLIVRQVRSWKRSLWRRFRLVERAKGIAQPVSSDTAMEEHASALSDRLEVLPAVEQLPFKLKEVIVLRYYQDCSLDDIATQLDIPVGTVKSRHHTALKQLRRYLNQRQAGEELAAYVHRETTKA